jgi:hypothetical protein
MAVPIGVQISGTTVYKRWLLRFADAMMEPGKAWDPVDLEKAAVEAVRSSELRPELVGDDLAEWILEFAQEGMEWLLDRDVIRFACAPFGGSIITLCIRGENFGKIQPDRTYASPDFL